MAKYLKRVEEDIERFGNVREAYQYEVGLLLERIARVERQFGVQVDVDALLPQRAMDIAGGDLHYRERRRWVEDVIRIRQEDILQHAAPREVRSTEEEPDVEITRPEPDNTPEPIESVPKDVYPPDDADEGEEDDDYGNANDWDDYPDSDDDEWDDIVEPTEDLPPSLADIQLERIGEQLDEYGDTPLVDKIYDVLEDAIEEQGKEAVGSRINANFTKLQKNIDNAIIYEEDRHAFNYFWSEVLKGIRGYGFSKEENLEATENAEKAGSVNPN